jgi:hypothetical protein
MRTRQRFDIDPDLEKISPHLPDEEINLLFAFRKFDTQGRRRKFKTNQLYRLHILAMIKGIPSFNKLCQELRTRRSFRDFCFFKNKKSTPPKRMLSEFRNHLKSTGFEKIAGLMTANFLNMFSLPDLRVAIPDATDMPARCSGFAKKNAIVLATANARRNIPLKELPKENERKKVVKVPILLATRSIRYVSG